MVTLNLTVHPVYALTLDEQICEGTSYDFHGNLITDAGTYVDTLNSINGCDSVITLNLTVLEVLETFLTDTICDGETLSFNGQDLTTGGTYLHTTTSSIGCDSIVTMDLTVLPIETETVQMEICEGDVYDFNGQMLTTSGSYQATVTGSNGCDSIVTLELTVNPVKATALDEEICEGDQYDFHGQQIEVSGTYVDTLSTSLGCDSVVTLNLTVHPVFMEIISAVICDDQQYDFHGVAMTESGTYVDTLTTVNGCDSIIILDLTVLPVLSDTLNVEICADEVYDFEGTELNQTGQYEHTLVASTGCDSVITLNLLVHELMFTTIDAEICMGENYDFNGDLINTAGTFVDTLSTIYGCDSIVTLNLIVHPVDTTFLSYDLCPGESVVVNSVTYSEEGSYTDTLISQFGCDSFLAITINMLEIKETSISASICNDVSYNFHGTLLDNSGVYVDTLTASNGCDSIVTLELEVLPVKETDLDVQVCLGQTYTFNGNVLGTSGLFIDTLTAATGCDSIVRLNLRLVETIEVTFDQLICEGESAMFNEVSYAEAGYFSDTLISSGGCDSVIHINITVAPIEFTQVDQSICEGDTFLFHGSPVTTEGLHYDTLLTQFGCDSIIELSLQVIPIKETDLAVSICEGESYTLNGETFTQDSIYDILLTAASGCDSIVHLDLTVIPTVRLEHNVQICQGEFYPFNGTNYDTSGTYIDTFISAAGCDSLDILNLEILPLADSSLLFELCVGESVTILGQEYTSSTSFTETFTSSYGCDSTVTYEVIVLPDVTLSAEDAMICVGESVQLNVTVEGAENVELVWTPSSSLSCADCPNPIASPTVTTTYFVSTLGCGGKIVEDTVIVEVLPYPGLTASDDVTINLGEVATLTATTEVLGLPIDWYDEEGNLICSDCPTIGESPGAPGIYTYVASAANQLGCAETDTVVVTVVDPCQVDEIEAANAFTPNGDGFNDRFEIRNSGVSTIGLVQVFNRWGEMVFESNDISDQWDGTFRQEPVNPGVYMYLFRGVCESGQTFIVSGNVTVIR